MKKIEIKKYCFAFLLFINTNNIYSMGKPDESTPLLVSESEDKQPVADQGFLKKFVSALSPRAIAKTVSYRLTGTLSTILMSYIITNNIEGSLALGSAELVIKPFIYYFHERVWGCISWRQNEGQ